MIVRFADEEERKTRLKDRQSAGAALTDAERAELQKLEARARTNAEPKSTLFVR